MRSQPISTPFGNYNTMMDCAKDIMVKNPEQFLQDNAVRCNFHFGPKQQAMTAAALLEYRVYKTVQALVGDQTMAEWCRMPTRSETAVQPPVKVSAKTGEVLTVSLAELAKFGAVFIGHTVKITA